MSDKEVLNVLKKGKQGLSITDICNLSHLPRSSVRTILAMLEGARQVEVRKIGMAKVYTLVGRKKR